MLNLVKLALRISKTTFDTQIQLLIDAAFLDLYAGGMDESITSVNADQLVKQAVITYCQIQFYGKTELQASYDMQKAQIGTNTGHTDWGD